MPELPEVETVVRELRKTILNKKIIKIEALWHKSFEELSATQISGQSINSINRLGKYLIINLTSSQLIIHLRMTGQLLFFNDLNDADLGDYIRVAISFKDNSALLFKDVRKFGRVSHVDYNNAQISHIGIDALDKNLTSQTFGSMLKKSGMSIKAFLIAQKFISGMGNIYTDEALFISKIHPALVANKLSVKKVEKLFLNMQKILINSINNMGSTISDYRDPAGNKGTNQNYFNVYGRENLGCKICGTQIEKIKFAGRGTHFCPKCQKI